LTSALARRLAPAIGVSALLALGIATAPAGAIVVNAEGVSVGLQPRSTTLFDGEADPLNPSNDSEPLQFANPAGNAVVPASKIYTVYWDPTNQYHGDWQEWIDGFLQGAGLESGMFSNVFSVDSQYTDKANQHAAYHTSFMGAYTDTEPYPSATCEDPQPLQGKDKPSGEPAEITCLTDQQIQAQLQHFIARHSLQKGMETIFYVLTPPGVTVCLNAGGASGHCSDYEYTSLESYESSFCSYHSFINPDNAPQGDANTVLYAAIPWTAGALGDGHLPAVDRVASYVCQDGGYNPSSEPIEQLEKKKEKTAKQEQEIKEKTPEEQAKIREAEELEGPHQEEPNQPTKGVGLDGTPDTGLVDLIINQVSEEQQNTITDPLLNGWQDPAGNEVTDECRNFFASANPLGGSVSANENTGAGTLSNQVVAGANYYLNDAFDLAALKLAYPGVPCIPGIQLLPHFTVPTPTNAGELVSFNGMESDVTLNWAAEFTATGEERPTYAFYKWNFGDGTPEVSGYAPGGPPVNPPTGLCEQPWRQPCAASVFHSYQYGGTYQVTLTVTDTGGNSASVTHPVTVVGPAPPSGGGPGGGSGGGTANSTSGGSAPASQTPTTGGQPSVTLVPGPVASAAAVSSSLKQVTRKGLVVHYAVNEQVAGRFEVLLAASTARALGIGGHVASGLPAGFPKSLVIGEALLVTTKGGHNSERIKFAKRIAKRLRHARKVTLTLRLKVRNASKSPLFTTVMSTVVLHR
jgi:PKD domain